MLFVCHEAPLFYRACQLPTWLSGVARDRTWIYGLVMFRSVATHQFICMDRHRRVVAKVFYSHLFSLYTVACHGDTFRCQLS